MTHCPHCQNPLPDAPGRFCPHCGGELEPVAPPPLPPGPAWQQGAAAGIPWERREGGLVAAFVETTQQVLTGPSDFFARMPKSGGIGPPVLYALVVGCLGVIVSAVYQTILQSVLGSAFMGLRGHSAAEQFLPYVQGWMGLVVQVVFAPFGVLFSIFLGAAILHVMLLMLGGAEGGFEATLRVRCYAEAAAVLNLLPFCGVFLQIVVMVVLLVVGLSAAHAISRGRAAAAVLLPGVLCCCCFGALAFAFAGAILAAVKSFHP